MTKKETNENSLEKAQTQEQDNSELTKEENSVDSLLKEIEILKEKNIRLIAENQNTVRRMKNEYEDLQKYAIAKFIKDFIDPIEVLFMAINSVDQKYLTTCDDQFKNLYNGLDMAKTEFIKTLEKYEIKRIYPLDESFNHNLHQAISKMEDKTKESNVILQVIKAGYTLHDRVLVPATVIVNV